MHLGVYDTAEDVYMETRPFSTGTQLSLTNDGRLELFFLGVGSAFTKRQYQTNLLVIKGEDHLLIDCGSRCSQALHAVGLSAALIQNLLITHSHSDHIGGLEELALVGRYLSKRKPVMVVTEDYQEILWEMSLRGGLARNEGQAGQLLGFEDFFEIRRPRRMAELPRLGYEVDVGKIRLKLLRTKHIPDSAATWEDSFWSCGVIIDERILFTSDTRYDPDLLLSACKAFPLEMIFHDCQFYTGGVHASLEELAALPDEIRAKTCLVHYGDNWEQFMPRVRELGFAGLGQQMTRYLF